MNKSIAFFERQFQQQAAGGDLCLNPFEVAALPYLSGRVLDFGCGLGKLSVAAARQGCSVLALDAAPTAIRHLAARAAEERLPIEAREADLRSYLIDEDFDAVVAIGLLMFFDGATARRQLAQLQARVRPGGVAVINVLIEGTSYLEMFDPAAHYLFGRSELRESFAGWEILGETYEDFAAPGELVKKFVTLAARKPKNAE
jgi:tellurite methyltransferase